MKEICPKQEGVFSGFAAAPVLITTMLDLRVSMVRAFVSLSVIAVYRISQKPK